MKREIIKKVVFEIMKILNRNESHILTNLYLNSLSETQINQIYDYVKGEIK